MVLTLNKDINYFFNVLIHAQKLFEGNLESQKKKQNGIFLTHKLETIDKIISIIDFSTIENKKILEPACGQGIIILRIIYKAYLLNSEQKFINRLIENTLIFNDIDAYMVESTIKNIKKLYQFLFDTEYTGLFQSYVSDFTLKNNNKAQTLFYTNKTIALEQFYDEIDYVVANPPYISLYGRRDKKENEQQRIDYLQNYNQFPNYVQNGKINLVMLFIEHAYCFLKKEKKLSFIIDLSFFETAYQYTRKFLLENTTIDKIILNIKDFEVVSGQIILQLTKTIAPKTHIVNIKDEKTKLTYQVKQKEWNNSKDEYRFRYNSSDFSQKIIDIIHTKKDKTILEVYPNKNLRTCTMLLDMEAKFTLSKKPDTNLPSFPYYQGSKSLSDKYGAFKYEKYFIYDKQLQDSINDSLKIELEKQGIKNKKRIGLGEPIIYKNPKIFIRQSAKELIASIDFEESAANNSLYVFSLRDNSAKSLFNLKFLCGLLNSDIMTFYAQEQGIIRFAQGKQPQIKISDLSTIPHPINLQIQEKIVALVDNILRGGAENALLKKEINHVLYNYYEISDEQIKYIEKSIKDF